MKIIQQGGESVRVDWIGWFVPFHPSYLACDTHPQLSAHHQLNAEDTQALPLPQDDNGPWAIYCTHDGTAARPTHTKECSLS
jgi:hypothetical protein